MSRAKIKLYRFFLLIKKGINGFNIGPKFDLDKNQKLGVSIFEKALIIEEAELLIAPLSHTYYIEAGDIFIILDAITLRIINGRYQYHIAINEEVFNKLSSRFKRVMEKRRKQMEDKITTKTNRSLQQILEDVSELAQ